MIYVGLTGGIGSGKTTVAGYFKELGVPIYNSDERAKTLMNSSKDLKEAIINLLGTNAYQDEKLNKTYIAKRVFSNKDLLQKLNDIVHPAVRNDFHDWALKQNSPYVIQEAAILFENGSYLNYDKLILVKAPKPIRLQRIVARDSSSLNQITERMDAQWDDERKIPLSDFIIENINLDQTKNQVFKIHKDLLKLIS